MLPQRDGLQALSHPASLMSHHLQKENKTTGISTVEPLGGEAATLSRQPTDCTHKKGPRSQLVTKPPSFHTGLILEEPETRLPRQKQATGPSQHMGNIRDGALFSPPGGRWSPRESPEGRPSPRTDCKAPSMPRSLHLLHPVLN